MTVCPKHSLVMVGGSLMGATVAAHTRGQKENKQRPGGQRTAAMVQLRIQHDKDKVSRCIYFRDTQRCRQGHDAEACTV